MEIDAERMMVKAFDDNNPDMAVKALSHGLDPRTYINSYQTSLNCAVRYRHEKIVRLLIPYSDCNQLSRNGSATAPTLAAYNGLTNILRHLLPHTDLTLRDRDGNVEDNAKKWNRVACLDLIQLWKSLIRNKPQTHTIIKMCLQWHEISLPTDFYEEVVEYWLIVSLDKK